MLNKLRVRAQSESGFTLVELLVVMLIIGLLAAIAIPAFFNQRNKANDASAKESVRTAQTALETYSTDHNGSYSGAVGGRPAGDRADRPRRDDHRGYRRYRLPEFDRLPGHGHLDRRPDVQHRPQRRHADLSVHGPERRRPGRLPVDQPVELVAHP